MHDFGGVIRKRLAPVEMFSSNQLEDLFEFGECRLTSVHQRVATPEGWDFGDPRTIILSIQNDLIVIEAHGSIIRRWANAGVAHL
jgi:hypothetical protein